MITFTTRTWIRFAFFIPVLASMGCMGHWLSPALHAPLVGSTTPDRNPKPLNRNPPLVTHGPKPPSTKQTPEVAAVVPHGDAEKVASVASPAPAPATTPNGPTTDSIHAMVATVQDTPPSVAAAASAAAPQPAEPKPATISTATEPPLEPVEQVDQAPVPSGLSQRLTAPLEGHSVADIVQFSTPTIAKNPAPPTPVAKSAPAKAKSKSTAADPTTDTALIRFRDDATDSLPTPPPEAQTTPPPAVSKPKTEKGWTAVTTDSVQAPSISENTEDL